MRARVRSESAQRVSGCVTALLREQPFFGSLALRLPVRADCGCYSGMQYSTLIGVTGAKGRAVRRRRAGG